MSAKTQRVRLSTKGQVVLPKSIRERKRWEPGASLIIEETPEGVLLTAAPLFAPSRLEDVFGVLRHSGRHLSIEEMDESVLAEARRRHVRD